MSKHLNKTNAFWYAKKFSYKQYINLIFSNLKDFCELQAFNPKENSLAVVGLLLNIKLNSIEPSAIIRYPNRYAGTYPLKDIVSATIRTSGINAYYPSALGLKTKVMLESMYNTPIRQTPPHLYATPQDTQEAWKEAIQGASKRLYKYGWEAVYLRAYLDYIHRWGTCPPAETAPHPSERGVVLPINEVCKEILLTK